jgi:hypothetical protein|tara:strand:- start:44 stop:1057 length:1014 start_codon:yes stop_codon:yes gene_type:complete
MTLISIPLTGVPKELRMQIEELLPEPLKVPGWKFSGYKWRKLTQINTKDSNGNTDNSVRISGTGDNEVLQVSLGKGLDTSCLTPSIYPNDNLLNGFNRLKNLKAIGYKEWIFAEYQPDESTSTKFQETFEDALDDARASMNKGFGQKIITDNELEELARKRFSKRDDQTKDSVKEWISTLDLNLSSQKIEGIAAKVVKDFSRKGVIDSYERKEAQEFLDSLGIGADLLNTYGVNAGSGDPTRVLRTMYQIMKNFVDNEDTMNIALFDSQAASHSELDANRKCTVDHLKSIDRLIMDYASARLKNFDTKPYEVLGSIPQAVGRENANEVKKEKKLIEI